MRSAGSTQRQWAHAPRVAARGGAWHGSGDGGAAIIQPSEFLLGPDRRVLHATYSSRPIGRIAADDVVKLVGFLEARAQARS